MRPAHLFDKTAPRLHKPLRELSQDIAAPARDPSAGRHLQMEIRFVRRSTHTFDEAAARPDEPLDQLEQS
jgi:hypothetical protein